MKMGSAGHRAQRFRGKQGYRKVLKALPGMLIFFIAM